MPERIATLAELPSAVAREHGASTALVCGARRATYAELAAQSARIARALARRGLGRGDRLLVVARDSIEWVQLLFGAARAGVVFVAVNWRWTADELAHAIDDAGARLVFADAERLGLAAAAIELSGRTPELLPLAAADAGDEPPDEPELPAIERDDPALQLYTSGTTGRPKGIVLAHRTFFAIADAMTAEGDDWMGWSAADVGLLFVPCFHIGGLWWLMRALALGSKSILVPFDPATILELIPRERVTRTCMVPAMMQLLLGEPGCETTDLSSLRSVLYGGSPIAPRLLERARRVFGCDFFQIYGLTETGNMALCLRPADHERPGLVLAAGRALPGVRVRILAPDGRELPPGQIGEIAILSPAQMLEYHRQPEATAQTLVDGWIRTGDGGYQDADGFVFVCDRLKDMLICAGENVYPAEIERVLRAHADVADAAVIGVPDELWGEAGLAFVVPRAGARLTPREVLRHARSLLSPSKIPRAVELVNELPRTPSGKVRKAALRETYWRGRERQVN